MEDYLSNLDYQPQKLNQNPLVVAFSCKVLEFIETPIPTVIVEDSKKRRWMIQDRRRGCSAEPVK